MIVALLCFLFSFTIVEQVRCGASHSRLRHQAVSFLIAGASYGASYLFFEKLFILMGFDLPESFLAVLAVTPHIAYALLAVAICGSRAQEKRLSAAECVAVVALFTRYRDVISTHSALMGTGIDECSPEHLINLCDEVIKNHQKYPFDKLCRWMGFVQGVLAAQGMISVQEERDFSRPLLHAIHTYTPPTYP